MFFHLMLIDAHLQDWDNNSTFMNHRQHHPDGNKQLAEQLERFFHPPDKFLSSRGHSYLYHDI